MARISSKAVSEHEEVPLADEGRWEALVSHWSERRTAHVARGDHAVACYVASVGASRDPLERAAQMAEIVALVRNQGGAIVGEEILHLGEPNPRTLLGKGTAQALAARARASGATMLVLDAELSPSQTRNLEDVAGISVRDREAIILEVFRRHARTRSAKILVEAARLEFLRPRIRGVGLDMDQQSGGTTQARGPGETASELLARKIDGRLEELKKARRGLETSNRIQRRKRDECARIVLVGYTNAGKTSLMNALTSAGLSARDMPFETLDTTSRCLTRHGGEVLISDTVGAIRRLPERLIASFESTLAEASDATLLVLVVDASDRERAMHIDTTHALLARIGASEIPRFYVFTKADRLPTLPDAAELARWSEGHANALLRTDDTDAVAALRCALLAKARRDESDLTAFVPYDAHEVLSLVYGRCRVLESVAQGDGIRLRITGPEVTIARIRSRLEARRA